MTKNIIIVSAAVALIAVSSPGWAKSVPTISASDFATYCEQSSTPGDSNVLVDSGSGTPVSVTIHCGKTDTTVGMNTDAGESEQGPAEAAENGVED